ncbi:MAG: hypothetical protein KDC52_00575 [Ignavibacteriae bacterium]|nr:hypothetical protein [Ignavibacteriota bacterium]
MKYDFQADAKIFFVDKEFEADLKIFYVVHNYEAGWNEPNSFMNRIK